MRPWLLLPILLPATWAGVTFAGVWPKATPEWVLNPLVAVGLLVSGLALAWVFDLVVGGHNRQVKLANKPVKPSRRELARRRKAEAEQAEQDAPALVEIDASATDREVQVWDVTSEASLYARGPRVDMPSATPAPRY